MFSVGDLFAIVVTWIWAVVLVPLNFALRILTLFFIPGILLYCSLLVPINFALRILAFLSVFGILVFFFPRLLKVQLPFRLECYPGCPGKKFERLINHMILDGLAKRGIHPTLVQDLIGSTGEFWPTFRDICSRQACLWRHHQHRRVGEVKCWLRLLLPQPARVYRRLSRGEGATSQQYRAYRHLPNSWSETPPSSMQCR
jgi:hypothetical protein